jgi:hypothetical protein
MRQKNTSCGWLAYRKVSKCTKKNIVKKDVVGLQLGEVVTMRKNTSSQKLWLAY